MSSASCAAGSAVSSATVHTPAGTDSSTLRGGYSVEAPHITTPASTTASTGPAIAPIRSAGRHGISRGRGPSPISPRPSTAFASRGIHGISTTSDITMYTADGVFTITS